MVISVGKYQIDSQAPAIKIKIKKSGFFLLENVLFYNTCNTGSYVTCTIKRFFFMSGACDSIRIISLLENVKKVVWNINIMQYKWF